MVANMDTIEKYDRLRFIYLKMFAISFMIWHGLFTYTLNFKIDIKFFKIGIIVIELSAAVVWAIYLFKLSGLAKKINKDKLLRNALNNELYGHIALKSARVSLVSFIISIGILIGTLSFINIPSILVCQILLFVVISSLFISYLVYISKS
jgi:hypothetical protein